MKKKSLSILMIMLFFSGCATNGTDLSKNGTVTIERINSKKLIIPWADAYEDNNGNLTIKGVVEQQFWSIDSLKGYVHVQLLSSNGEIIKQARTSNVIVPRNLMSKGGINWTRFRLTIPITVSKGMTIKLFSEVS